MEHACFLFGHRDADSSAMPRIIRAIEDEVERGTTDFYTGYHGQFDRMAAQALRSVKLRHPHVRAFLVLAHHPSRQRVPVPEGFDGSFYPPLECVPERYALVRANRYMIAHVESVICYVSHPGNCRALLAQAVSRQKKCSLIVKNTSLPRVDL